MFSVGSTIAAHRIGETSEGYRVDIDYTGGHVTTDWKMYKESWQELFPAYLREAKTDEAKRKKLAVLRSLDELPFKKGDDARFDWYGLEGKLVSGSDWLLIRSDGVAELDSRVTLQEDEFTDSGGKAAGGALINTELGTVVDLWQPKDPATERRPPGSVVYEAWKASKGSPALRFTMALRFNLAEASQPWAGADFKSTGSFWRYESLPRYDYVGNAKATVESGLITGVYFDVWRVGSREPPNEVTGS